MAALLPPSLHSAKGLPESRGWFRDSLPAQYPSGPTTPPRILSRAVNSPPPAVRLAAASGILPPTASFPRGRLNKWRPPAPSPPLRTSVLPGPHETLRFTEEHPGKVPDRA